MATFKVTCREKHSLYQRVVSIGCVDVDTGVFKRFTEDEAIKRIKQLTDNFFIEKPLHHRVWLIVAEHEGREYLKTEADGEKPNNLLEQPECPAKKQEPTGSRRTIVAARSHGAQPFVADDWGT